MRNAPLPRAALKMTQRPTRIDPPRETLVPRVQLTTEADEEVTKRCGLLDKGSLLTSQISFSRRQEIIVLSSDSSDDRKGPSKANVPIFEGPSVQGLLDYYGYNDIEEYLSWNYFPSTDKENIDKDIRDKDTTDEDCIHEFGSPAIERLGSQSEWVASSREEQRNKNDRDIEGHGLGDEDHGLDDKSQGLEDEGLGLEEEEVVPEGQQQAVPVVETVASEPLGLGYGALRRRELAVREDQVPSTFEVGQSSRSVLEQQGAKRVSAFRQPTLDTWVYTDIPAYIPQAAPVQTSPSPEWSLGSLQVSPSSHVVPSPIALPMATPTATISVDEDQFIEFRNLEQEQERATMTFGALWRPVLALEAWAGHVDTRLADMSRARYDDNRLIQDMLVQQAAMQRELQEMRGRVTILEQEGSHREQ
ncbi:hypothetical protein Tco_1005143 [Tanacetum coccineum]|uniref:Uncharacterized protein n=1 Tax=Tanacetum coccineum TaxID=301880 RepID=A0ABQ5FE84_9ASTR